MTTAPLFDMVQMSVSGAPGTGTIALGAATIGYQTFAAAGVANGDIVSYSIVDAGNAWEVGHATYNSAGPTLSGRVVTFSSNGNAAVSLTSAAIVSNALLVADILIGQGQLSGSGITSNAQIGSINLPPNAFILYALLRETNGVATTVTIGSSLNGSDVMSAVNVPAAGTNTGTTEATTGSFSDIWFSATSSQALYLTKPTDGASINIQIVFKVGP